MGFFLSEKSSSETPLLAAEGFVIQKIQIQKPKSAVISAYYSVYPDPAGAFACPGGGYDLSFWGRLSDPLGVILTFWGLPRIDRSRLPFGRPNPRRGVFQSLPRRQHRVKCDSTALLVI